MAAFSGESQARNKYTYYGKLAKKAGYEQISRIFYETAENERAHAEIWFKLLHGEKVPSTVESLKDAAAGEWYEFSEMYKQFEADAKEEGYDEIASLFKMVGNIEKEHNERFMKLSENVENGEVFKRPEVKVWKCLNCGHIHVGEEAPNVCPVCSHPQSYFEVKADNY
ncbi:MAG: rubrerythrin family protein [Clostridia bacterium]|nr:rubrerythrin family protein [Clostridia bacterium]